ncbi:AraC family transcriptional regulator [Mucilaginibacter sp. RS28]|uniref:AraC family transcriptional regulator n=1 Tax=Mucilaginibacter straminoryzae TaxID=2932774 RepID=A0A9X2B8W6_9SPHI|nr:AraC family transcriptional regulator [Mucilaginibacter straminoryzae]MCJ8210029.1 AraC family transcriptional regulator [Mucilaginibacter straminoryzae]
MKAHFLKVPIAQQNSFSIRRDVQPSFRGIWHYHPELELHYIIKGEGVRFIGNKINNFSAGEIVLLGENLPHCWRCKEEYFQNNPDLNVEAIVVHFLPEFLGPQMLNLPETFQMAKMFERAKNGLMVKPHARKQIAKLMEETLQANNLTRIISLLKIFDILIDEENTDLITTNPQTFLSSNEAEIVRLKKIYSYTLTNYKNEISLEEIASISNLSVTSFCRYFKLMTKKTYYDFLTEIRISHAYRMLIENKLPTEVICYECGFNNVSNFYRHFKKVTKMTPLAYKRKYLQGK